MQWLGGGVVSSIKARWRHTGTQQQQQEMAASLDTETAAMETEGRAPLASQEATATPAPALCGQVSEFTRGKEFKVFTGRHLSVTPRRYT